jgi:DNA-binding transcriptional MocR family regulator
LNASIDALHRVVARQPGSLSLAGGLPLASLFPRHLLGVVSLEAARDLSGSPLQYGWPEGSPSLREWIAADLRRRGADVVAGDVIVTSGAQQAIAPRAVYSRRVEALMLAVRRHLPSFSFCEPEGGFTLFVSSSDTTLDEVAVLRRATALGTSFDPGTLFRHDDSTTAFAMRLSPCNVPETSIDAAVARLARAVSRHAAMTRGLLRRSSRAAMP